MKKVVLFIILLLAATVQAGHEEFYANHGCWDDCEGVGLDQYIPCREACGDAYDGLKAVHDKPAPITIPEQPKIQIYDWDIEFIESSSTEITLTATDKATVNFLSKGTFSLLVSDDTVFGGGNARVDINIEGELSGIPCKGSHTEQIALTVAGKYEDGTARIQQLKPLPKSATVKVECTYDGAPLEYSVEVPLTLAGELLIDLEDKKVIKRAMTSYIYEWETDVRTDWTFTLKHTGKVAQEPEEELLEVPHESPAIRIGAAAAVNGDVQVLQPNGTWKKAHSGMILHHNGLVVTGPKGRMQVLLMDETVFTIGARAELVLDDFVYDPDTDAGQITANVAKGVFRFVTGKVARRDPSKMKIKLPVGTIGIRGTDFITDYDPDSETATVYLNYGELLITPEDGQEAIVYAGEVVTFGRGDVSPPTELSMDTWDALVAEIEPVIEQAESDSISDESFIIKIALYIGYTLGILLVLSPLIVLGLAIYLFVRWRRKK